jgi:hypothetical protein
LVLIKACHHKFAHPTPTINSPLRELLPLSSSNLSRIISSTGELEKSDDNQPILEAQKRLPLVKTAISRWLAVPIASLFPKAHSEEWLGDLYESHQEMIDE